MMYNSHVTIRDMNNEVLVDEAFEDYLERDYYVVIDTQELGEAIGRKIIDNRYERSITDENGEIDYTIIYEEIDKQFNNSLINTIYGFVEEYLHNNLD